jgi:ERCC4-related helicase
MAVARADKAASLVTDDDYWLLWVDTNDEADALKSRLPNAVEVRGSMSIEEKEETLDAFATGQARCLIIKPSIGGQGLNLQHCANMAYVGRTFSYEAWYQSVRRCWRFGQKRPVNVHLIVAEGEDQIGRVIDRKSDDHASMKAAMALAMARATGRRPEQLKPYNPTYKGRLPSWLAA